MPTIPTLVDSYRTCELLTVGRDGTPIAWPTCAVRRTDGTFLISTSIGLPQKAINIRRDPRVALLFSDPTGSGLEAPDQILVQGAAACPDEIVTSPGPWSDLWLSIRERQPSSSYHRMPGLRRLMDFYYMRLLITVTPERITTLPAWRPRAFPQNTINGAGPYAEAVRRLPDFTSAVLAAYDADGRPTLRRVHPVAPGGMFTVDAGDDARAGRASLLWHRHDEKLAGVRAFVVAGELDAGRLTPERYVSIADGMNPIAMTRTIRRLRATAARYLARRGLDRPVVPWNEYTRMETAAKLG